MLKTKNHASKKSNDTSPKKAKSAGKSVKKAELSVTDILAQVRPTPMIVNNLGKEEKITLIAQKFTEIMEVLGLDLANDSLHNTPHRIAKMYVNEVFAGLDPDNFPKITIIDNEMEYDQMVLVQGVEVLSVCEHHFQTIHGKATVAYIPNKKVIGLSKINRIVQFFSRRPQVQERLTKQIADCLQYVLDSEHVAVHINAKHYCVIARGIEDNGSSTATSDLRGHFKSKPETRIEFLKHCATRLEIC